MMASSDELPWSETISYGAITTDAGYDVALEILCYMEKGFAYRKDKWLAYRRNYFAVTCAVLLNSQPNSRVFFSGRAVQAFVMGPSAAISPNAEGTSIQSRPIKLAQFTSKRIERPLEFVHVVLGMPLDGSDAHDHFFGRSTPAPCLASTLHLPLQTAGQNTSVKSEHHTLDPSPLVACTSSNNSRKHCFDRLQFKSATYSGRPNQQSYYVIITLWADVRDEDSRTPDWRKVAAKESAPVIVRSRHPAYYIGEDNKLASADEEDTPLIGAERAKTREIHDESGPDTAKNIGSYSRFAPAPKLFDDKQESGAQPLDMTYRFWDTDRSWDETAGDEHIWSSM